MHQNYEYEAEFDTSHMNEKDKMRFEALEAMARHNYDMAETFYKQNEKNRSQVILWRLIATVSCGVMAGWWLTDKFL